ncbi:DJ-1/PfpI family protein [Elsinoe ampelina]|uniref:DJ-1/PfpI family protein n=1 Tax=Elsinoe ampelina TaxID=302913 RepID=A0A6A6GCZ8_9PEZI|nr:DJ-1/PfpI family protein [Elsinoe ampelina]
MPPPPLQVCVLSESVQLSDITPADLIGNLSGTYLTALLTLVPSMSRFTPFAPDITFHFPATTLAPTTMTPGITVLPSCTYDDVPRDIDVLLVGGPLLDHCPEAAARLMREVWEAGKATVLTTCVGSLWFADAIGEGLEGRRMTTNRGFIPAARKVHPGIEWVDQRWVVEEGGRLWTAGGAGAGVDMVGTWLLGRFDEEFVRWVVLDALEVYPDAVGQFYKGVHPALEAEKEEKLIEV